MEYEKKTSGKTQSVVLLPRKLWILSKGIGKSPEQIVGKREEELQPVVIAKPEGQDAIMGNDPAERKEAYEAIVGSLSGENPEVLEEVEESLQAFKKTMAED